MSVDLDNLRNEEEFIRLCILNGKWCSPWAHKIDYFGEDWLIDSMSIMGDNNYCGYGNDIYISVKLYYEKLNDKTCFSNGYHYTTGRIVKLSDIIMYKRFLKLKKLKEKICQ